MKTIHLHELFFTIAGAYLLSYSIIDLVNSSLKGWFNDTILFISSFILLLIANALSKTKEGKSDSD